MIMPIHRRCCRRRYRRRVNNVPCARARAVITTAAARAVAAVSCALPCIHRLQFSRACAARARCRRSGLRFVYGTPGTPAARCYRSRFTCRAAPAPLRRRAAATVVTYHSRRRAAAAVRSRRPTTMTSYHHHRRRAQAHDDDDMTPPSSARVQAPDDYVNSPQSLPPPLSSSRDKCSMRAREL